MSALVVIAAVLVFGVVLALGIVRLPGVPSELNGYPTPMIAFAVVAALGILIAGTA